jgi:plasmid stability protein
VSNRSKAISLRFHIVKDRIRNGEVVLHHVPGECNSADLLTKPLRAGRHNDLTNALLGRDNVPYPVTAADNGVAVDIQPVQFAAFADSPWKSFQRGMLSVDEMSSEKEEETIFCKEESDQEVTVNGQNTEDQSTS